MKLAAAAATMPQPCQRDSVVCVHRWLIGAQKKNASPRLKALYSLVRRSRLENGVKREVGAQHEALAQVVARAEHGIGQVGAGGRGIHQAQVREVVEAAEADAGKGREALVRPGLGQQVDLPEVGARIGALHLAEGELRAERVAESVAAPDLEHRLAVEQAPGGAQVDTPHQVVVDRQVAKALGHAGFGERGLQLRARHPADLARRRAHLVPIGVAQLDADPLVARGDVEHRVAATGAGAQFDVGVGDLHPLFIGLGGMRAGRRSSRKAISSCWRPGTALRRMATSLGVARAGRGIGAA